MKGRLFACLALIFVPLILSGQDWEELRTDNVEAVTVMTGGTIVALSNGVGYRSTDDGESWVTGNVSPSNVTTMKEGPGGQLFAATYFGRGGLNRSTDRGNSWQYWANIRAWDVTFNSQGHILVATEGTSVIRSTDAGANWTRLRDDGIFWSVAVDRQDNIYVGAQGDGIYRSTDNGETWADLFGDQRAVVDGLAVAADGTIYFSGAMGMGVMQGPLPMVGFFRSTNGGETWEDISPEDSAQVGKRIIITSSGTLYIAATSVHPPFGVDLLRSTDRGETWESFATEMGFDEIHALAMDDRQRLYVAAGEGLHRLETTSSAPSNFTPLKGDVTLELLTDLNGIDSYIRVRVEGHRNGSVEIIDVQGRLVGDIPLDPFASGEQRLNPSELNLQPGVYICRLSNAVESQGIKMIVR